MASPAAGAPAVVVGAASADASPSGAADVTKGRPLLFYGAGGGGGGGGGVEDDAL